MEKKHGFTPKYTNVQATTAAMNIRQHSRCHYKQDSGSVPAGMNNLHRDTITRIHQQYQIVKPSGDPVNIVFEESAMRQDGTVSVSYTHLDVYKRQV